MSEMQPKTHDTGMNDFEKQVAQALRQVDVPSGFADRLMARAEEQNLPATIVTPRSTGAKVIAFPKPRSVWMSGAIAAALFVGTFIGVDVHRQQKRERATQEFETATRITDQAMQHTREQLERAGVHLEE